MMEAWTALAPLLPLLAAALFYLVLGHRFREEGGRASAYVGVLAVLSSAVLCIFLATRRGQAFGGLLAYDTVTAALGCAILLGAAAALLLAPTYLARRGQDAGDFSVLVLMASAGLLLLVMSREVLTAILALETASVCLYALAGYDRGRASSAEAALKYFVPGAVASALMLYGAACLYGATGSTHLEAHPGLAGPLGLTGIALLVAGLGFKAGLVPFHGWLPDVYAGSPSPSAAFMAASVKAGAFGVLARVAVTLLPAVPRGALLLAGAAVLSMTFANLAGLAQSGLKRLLAYSAIAHSGYLVVGLAAASLGGSLEPLAPYLFAYALLTVGAFSAAALLEDRVTGGLELTQLRGLGRRRPVLAFSLAMCLLGLAGFPPTVGFLAKAGLFGEASRSGLNVLVAVALLNSAVALAYYLRPILAMFMQPEPEGAGELPGDAEPECTTAGALAFACGVGGILLGLAPAVWF